MRAISSPSYKVFLPAETTCCLPEQDVFQVRHQVLQNWHPDKIHLSFYGYHFTQWDILYVLYKKFCRLFSSRVLPDLCNEFDIVIDTFLIHTIVTMSNCDLVCMKIWKSEYSLRQLSSYNLVRSSMQYMVQCSLR